MYPQNINYDYSFLVTYLSELFLAFLGFALGRYADKYFGHREKIWTIPIPHHWIWGALAMIIGLKYQNTLWGISLFSFGIGHFISDLNDFFHLRFFGEEPPHIWRFWNID